MHIKTINGRGYYYKTYRKDGKVKSTYVEPVKRVRNRKKRILKKKDEEVTIDDSN